MIDITKARRRFAVLRKKDPIIYFDNAATMLKSQNVVRAVAKHYRNGGGSPHGDDYSVGLLARKEYEEARKTLADFIGARPDEVIFTSGATEALNAAATMLAYSLHEGDEVLISRAEHASNVLPWFRLQKEKGIKVKYVPLTKSGRVTFNNVKKAITEKTKVISLAHMSNVLGYVVDLKSISAYAHTKNIFVVADGAQSAPHIAVNVRDLGCDFYAVAGHKMGGPTGIGALFVRREVVSNLEPHNLGGGMNARFYDNGDYTYVYAPDKFEAGSQNVDGAIGLAAAAKLLKKIGMDEIRKREISLKNYAVKRLKNEVPGIQIYNANAKCGILAFNLPRVFAQDAATHFNAYGICVRAGDHCARLLPAVIGTKATVRASFAYYNTKEEIDKFVEAAKKGDDYLDVFFR